MDVSIDGTWTTCLVDTGATGTVVRSDLVDGDTVALGFAGVDMIEWVASSAEFGDPILQEMSDQAELDVGCILGWNSLSEQAFTLDYAEQRIRFDRKGGRAARMDDDTLGDPLVVDLSFTGEHPMAEATMNGVDLLVAIDTGASVAHIQPEIFGDLDPQPEVSPATVSSADGIVLGDFGTFDKVILGEAVEDDVDFVSFHSLQIEAAQRDYPIQGLIGASFLTRYVVTFDRKHGEMVLQPYPEALADALVEDLRQQANTLHLPDQGRIP